MTLADGGAAGGVDFISEKTDRRSAREDTSHFHRCTMLAFRNELPSNVRSVRLAQPHGNEERLGEI